MPHVGGHAARDVAPFSEAEYTAAQALLDEFYVTTNTATASKVHLFEDCQMLANGNSNGSATPKPPTVFPFGHRSVCNYCICNWREAERLLAGAVALDGALE